MGAEKQKSIKSIKSAPVKNIKASIAKKQESISQKQESISKMVKKQRVIDLIKGNKLSISALLTQLKNANIMSKNVTEQDLINCTILANYNAVDPSSPSGKGIKEMLNIKSTLRDILENLTPDEQ